MKQTKEEIIETINKTKEAMQQIEFKALFNSIVLNKDIQIEYVKLSDHLTFLQDELSSYNVLLDR